MKLFFAYLKDKKMYFLMIISVCAVFLVVNELYSAPAAAEIYACEICFVIFFIVMIMDYINFYRKHKILQKHESLKELYVLEMEPAKNTIERDYQLIVNKLIEEKRELSEKSRNAQKDMTDYYSLWAHQVKTPIAAMDLLLQVMESNPDEVKVWELKGEMFKIDFYVDAVMNYLRLEDMSSDFKFVKVSLKNIVNKSVKRFAGQFIHKHISVELKEIEREVYSDEKWLGFIIEQLLSNAIKYTKEGGKVSIYLKETFNANDCILVIEDNGIGIDSEDLPRIMERGYTGYNGRGASKSSGIGLYLCKKSADKLGIRLTIESEPYIGTKVYLSMEQKHRLHG